jgi:hypothetical protein
LEEAPVLGCVVGLGGFGHFPVIFMRVGGLKVVLTVRRWS